MKILHYALGFPPYRSGGLTKFCVDLMAQQATEGHEVAMLWPGQMGFIRKRVSVRKRIEHLKDQSIQSFEVINPLPISFDEGIVDIEAFIKDEGQEAYEKLLDDFRPDIIHIHTLMGLHKNFLNVAKKRKIKIVFTAHDFFPICPKVTMFRHGEICNSVQSCEKCAKCNTTALSLNKIKILQSPFYRRLKNSPMIKKLRKKHRDDYLSESNLDDSLMIERERKDYKRLRNYYYSLLSLVDIVHYNSMVTKKVYESVFDLPNNCIVSITHSDIKDNRKIKDYSSNKLHIRYLGPQGRAKGFFLLKDALDKMWNEQKNFCLDIHFTPVEMTPYIKSHGRYTYSDLKDIFDDTDVLVAPSILYETFGFTVLEALSYGVPVVISENVGAKDIMVENAGVVIENITAEKLCTVMRSLSLEKLKKMNQSIVEKQSIMQMKEMSEKIEKECYGWEI